MEQTATNKIQSSSNVSVGAHILYPALIFAVWLVTYIICRFVFPHMLGWDEMAYLSVGRGIAEDFETS